MNFIEKEIESGNALNLQYTTVEQGKLSCNTCGVEQFDDLEQQKEHFKTDWHLFNVKKQKALSEDEFNQLIQDDGYLSDISAPNSDDEEDFEANEEDECALPSDDVSVPILVPHETNMVLILLFNNNGHFAGAIYRNQNVLVVSKCFHRYTSRRKQGGSQSKNDNKSGKAKSAGANLRRYNEQMLHSEIQQLLAEWAKSNLISRCTHIFVSINKQYHKVIYDGVVLDRKDARIRRIPFQINRPTLNETKRVLLQLYNTYPHQGPTRKPDATKPGNERMKLLKKLEEEEIQQQQKVQRERELEQLKLQQQRDEKLFIEASPLHVAVTEFAGDISSISQQLDSADVLIDAVDNGGNTALHLATALQHATVVELLLERGADPRIRNFNSLFAYQLADSAALRKLYRVYRGRYPDKYDYKMTGIPEPITDDSEREKKERKKAKKKAQKQRKQLEKQQQVEQQQLREQQEQRERELAEAARLKCSCCEKPILDEKKAFHRFDYAYCTTACLNSHKRQLAAKAAEARFK